MTRWKPPSKAKRDANEPAIIAALQAEGWTVWPLDQPVDLLVTRRGFTCVVEVKNPDGKNKDTPKQTEFYSKWPISVPILRTEEDVRAFSAAHGGLLTTMNRSNPRIGEAPDGEIR